MKGIDVSEHNGAIDWQKVKADFCIIRAGYGKHISQKDLTNRELYEMIQALQAGT